MEPMDCSTTLVPPPDGRRPSLPLCWQRGYTDPFLPSLFPFLRTSKWKPQARPMPVSPYQSPPPGAFLEVEGAPAKKKKHHVRAANPVLAAGASHIHRISCSKGN